jgi:hypothetical protein
MTNRQASTLKTSDKHHNAMWSGRLYHCSFSLSKVTANLLNKVSDLHVYTNDEVLTYVITLPLVSRGKSEVLKLIPI